MKYEPIELPGFSGGLNKRSDAAAVQPNELVMAMNVRIMSGGEVQRRSGYKQWSDGIPSEVHHLHRWREPNGTEDFLAVQLDGGLYIATLREWFTLEGNVGDSIYAHPERYPVGFAAGEEFLYISSLRDDHTKRWDGTTLVEVTSIYDPPDEDDEAVYREMPAGQHLVYRHGRMYVGHTATEKSRIWFSNVLRPEVYTEESWIDLDPEDGTSITAMVGYADELFVFKDNSMWELTGRDPTTYALRTIDKLRGTVSPKTVCQMRGMLVFFDRDTGIWGYDGSQLTLLSQKINEYVLEGQDYDMAVVADAYFGDDRLYVSIPWHDDTFHTFVMNADNGAWSEYDSGFLVGDYHQSDRFQAMKGKAGILIADPTLNMIDGEEYYSWIRTGWMIPGGAGVKSRLRRVEVVVEADPGGLFYVEMYRNMWEHDRHVVKSFHVGVEPAQMIDDRDMHTVTLDGWGSRFNSFQLVVQMMSLPSKVNKLTAFTTSKPDVRGERR